MAQPETALSLRPFMKSAPGLPKEYNCQISAIGSHLQSLKEMPKEMRLVCGTQEISEDAVVNTDADAYMDVHNDRA